MLERWRDDGMRECRFVLGAVTDMPKESEPTLISLLAFGQCNLAAPAGARDAGGTIVSCNHHHRRPPLSSQRLIGQVSAMRRHAAIAALAAAAVLCLPAIAQAPAQIETTEDARAALDAARQQQRNAARAVRSWSGRLRRRARRRRRPAPKPRRWLRASSRPRRVLLPPRPLWPWPIANAASWIAAWRSAAPRWCIWPARCNRCRAGHSRFRRYNRGPCATSSIPARCSAARSRSCAADCGLALRTRSRSRTRERGARALVQRRDSEAVLLQRRRQLVARAAQEQSRPSRLRVGRIARRNAHWYWPNRRSISTSLSDSSRLPDRFASNSLPARPLGAADPTAARPSAVPEPLPSETAASFQIPAPRRRRNRHRLRRNRSKRSAPGGDRTACARTGTSDRSGAWEDRLRRSLSRLRADCDRRTRQWLDQSGYRHGCPRRCGRPDRSAGIRSALLPQQGGAIALELRQDGNPVNPLDYLGLAIGR